VSAKKDTEMFIVISCT